MSYSRLLQEDRRLVLLRTLADVPSYTANAYVLSEVAKASGHSVSLDTVKTELAWLKEQGLVELVEAPPLLVASITERGLDVARGHAVAPGVKRPQPGS